jgi:uncharacterized protein YggE
MGYINWVNEGTIFSQLSSIPSVEDFTHPKMYKIIIIKGDRSMRRKFQLIALTIISAVAVLLISGLVVNWIGANSPVAQAQTTTPVQALPGTITVVGEGKVKAQPDMAQASIGVEIINPDVKQASDEAASTMEAVLAALKAQGVADSDIQTSYYNIWVERPYSPEGTPSTEAIYHVSNNVQVTIRDLSKVTLVLGAAIEAGANTINSVTFNVTDPTELRSQARQQAVENGKTNAEELATLNGVTLGEVVSVSEVISSGAYYVSEVAAAQGLGGGGGGPILPGEVEVSVQLQISYAIQ